MTGADVRAGKPGRYSGNWKPICLRLVIDIKQPIMDAGAGAMQVCGWNPAEPAEMVTGVSEAELIGVHARVGVGEPAGKYGVVL